MDTPIIRVADLHKSYQLGDVTVHALRGVTLELARGTFATVVGASGSGKSTFMNILGLLDHPTSGQLLPGGRGRLGVRQGPAGGAAEPQDRLRVPELQPAAAHDRASRTSSCRCSTATSRSRPADRHAKAQALLQTVGLGERSHHTPNQLSGGQQQRVAIARALVNDPEILLADEPTGNLDSRTSIEIMDVLQRLNRERGITIILITHEQDIAEYGQRVIAFRDGRVVTDEAVSAQRGRPPRSWRRCRRPRWRWPHDARQHAAAGRQGAAPQQGPLGADHAGRRHRRGLGHRHDRAGLGRARRHRPADAEPGHERGLRLVRQLRPRRRRRARRRRQHQHPDPRGRAGHRPAADGRAHLARARARACRSWRATRTGTPRSKGGNEEYVVIRNWPIASGSNITARDVLVADKVAILGATVARTLFPDQDPVGQVLRVKNMPFRILGVLAPKGQGQFGDDQDDFILAPYTTVQKKVMGITHLQRVLVSARDADQVERDRGGHHAPAARAAPDDRARGRRLHGAHGRGDGAVARRDGEHHDHAAHVRGLREPAGGRHRHHEHHAGVGDGADARDRAAHGGGRAHARHPAASSCRRRSGCRWPAAPSA